MWKPRFVLRVEVLGASQGLLLVLPTDKPNTILVVTVGQKRSLFLRHEGADEVGEPH
jgi:hypothetical protein